MKRVFDVEYRKQSAGGRSSWKRCKAATTLSVAADTGRRLRYEVCSSGKTHEAGWLHESRSRVELGHAGLKAELQRTTLCITAAGDDGEPSSFCVTLGEADIEHAKTMVAASCVSNKRQAAGALASPSPKRSGSVESMGPPAPRAARALGIDCLRDIETANDDQLESLIRDCVEEPSFGSFVRRVDAVWRQKFNHEA